MEDKALFVGAIRESPLQTMRLPQDQFFIVAACNPPFGLSLSKPYTQSAVRAELVEAK